MPSWLVLSLSATVFYGIMNFLYKTAAERNYMNQAVIMISSSTVALTSGIIYLASGGEFTMLKAALPYAAVNGSFFAAGALFKYQALKKAPASVVFPVNKSNVLFVIIIGVFYFRETPSAFQWAGVGLSVLVLLLLSSEQLRISGRVTMQGILFAVIAAMCTSLSMTAGKLASEAVNRTAYILISYIFVVLISYLTYLRTGKNSSKKAVTGGAGIYFTGISIGLLNFAGYSLVLKAFAAGSISLVQPVFALSILIPVFLSAIIYREKLTPVRILSLAASLVSVILIRSA